MSNVRMIVTPSFLKHAKLILIFFILVNLIFLLTGKLSFRTFVNHSSSKLRRAALKKVQRLQTPTMEQGFASPSVEFPTKSQFDILMQMNLLSPPFHHDGPRTVRPENASDPVFVLGMPKSGTSSIAAYFKCGRGEKKVSHWICDRRKYDSWKDKEHCADCIYHNVNAGEDPLKGCGNFDVWAQMDREGDHGGLCYFPQIEALEELHQYYPTATLILNLRPLDKWVSSVKRWGTMHSRLVDCDITGFPRGMGYSEEDLSAWYKSHAANVWRFASNHRSHGLVTVRVEDDDTGRVLEKAFGISHNCWGKHNVNQKANS